MSNLGEAIDPDLEEILDVDVSAIQGAEFGGTMPKLLGVWEITEATVRKRIKDEVMVGWLANWKLKLVQVKLLIQKKDKLTGEPIEEDSLIDRELTLGQPFRIDDGSVKYVIGQCEKLGGKKGRIADMMQSTLGNSVQGLVTHRPNRNDPDRPFVGLDKIKIL